jgi:hypothetical protein
MCPICLGPQDNSVMWQNNERCKEVKLMLIMCIRYQVPEFCTWNETLRRYTLYKKSSKTLWRCCNVGMTAKPVSLFRVKGSDNEGDAGTAGKAKWRKQAKQQWLPNCHVNVATSHFYCWRRKSVRPWRLFVGKISNTSEWNTWYSITFPSLYFSIFY